MANAIFRILSASGASQAAATTAINNAIIAISTGNGFPPEVTNIASLIDGNNHAISVIVTYVPVQP
jgi:hypothetical protein